MPDYKFGDTLFTEDDVKQRAQEKGLTIEEYLTQNPDVKAVNGGKTNGDVTGANATSKLTASNTGSTSVESLSASLVAPIGNRNEWITPSFFDLQEEEVVGQLRQRYPDFKFRQSGNVFTPFDETTRNDPRAKQRVGLVNFVEVEAPNGEKLLLETALSSASQKVVNKKGGKEFLDNYYKNQVQDLISFIDANQVAKTEDLYTAKKKRRSIYEKFNEATKLTDQEIQNINDEFPDTSVFDVKPDESFTTYIPTRERVAGLPIRDDVEIQPHKEILEQAKAKLKEDKNVNFNDPETIKQEALIILKNNAAQSARDEKTRQYLEEIEAGNIPDVLQEDIARFVNEGDRISIKDIKPFITVGAKEYDEDLTSFMLGTVKRRVVVEDLQSELQKIIDKKVYTEDDKVQYEETFKKYESSIKDYNDTVEALSSYAVDMENKAVQLNILQRNYNDWDKQGANLFLNFRDFAAKAAYGLNTMIPAVEGTWAGSPSEEDPTMTNEEVETQKLVNILNQSQIIRSGYSSDVSFDNAFKSPANFAKWTVTMGNSQLPILASLATPHGWSALLLSSFGENFKEMTYEEMKTKAAAEELGFDYSAPEHFEKNSKFNKWAFSMMFAAPEVILDKATTGMRVRGIKEMFTKSSKDQLIDTNLKEVMSNLAFGLPQDAILGSLSEGTTQLWQNFLTGKEDVWEGVGEAAFSGLLMDGVLSSMPTLKAAVYTQMSDPQKIKEIQAAKKKLDTLYTIRNNAPTGGSLDAQIKELEQEIEIKIRENVNSIIGVGSRGLTANAIKNYIELTSHKATLKNRAQSIINDNLLTETKKQEMLNELFVEYEAVKQMQKKYESEKGSEFAMFAANPKNKAVLDVYIRQAKSDLTKEGEKNISDLEIQDRARILYNTDKILKEEAGVKKILAEEVSNLKEENKKLKKAGKKTKPLDSLDKTITYVKTKEEFDNWINEKVQPYIDALLAKENRTDNDNKRLKDLEDSKNSYKEGGYGFNVEGNSVAIVENMANDDRLEIRTHELGHEIGRRAFKNDPTIFNGMSKTILDWAKVNDEGLFNRLQRITGSERDQNIKAEEVMSVFFEEVAADRVKLKSERNRGLLSIFGFGTNKAIKDKYGIDFDLAGVEDTFELVYGIAKKISKSTITAKEISELSKSKAAKELRIQGEKIINEYVFATENVVKKAAKTGIFEKGKKIDKLPDSYNLEEWQKKGADTAITEMLDDLQGLILSKGVALKNLPNFSQDDYLYEVLGGMMKVIRNFNPWKKEFKKGINPIFQALIDKGVKESDIPKMTWGEIKDEVGSEVVGNYGFSGWVNSQLMYKVYDAQKSGKITTQTYSVDESADTFKEIVATEDDLELLEDEDLSLQAQLRKRQKEKRRAERGMQVGVEYSKFRRELELNGQKGISDLLKAKIQSITLDILASPKYIDLDLNAIKNTLRRDLELALHKVIKDAMGTEGDYVDFLTRNKNTILRHMDVSSLVTFERLVKPENRMMTEFVRRLQTQKDVQDAVDNGWLAHVDNPAQGPNLYKVLQPSIGDYLKFYLPPSKIESGKKVRQWNIMSDIDKQKYADGVGLNLEQARKQFVEVRSMNKGERKKSLSEKIGGQLAFDATMEIIQGEKFASLRAMRGKPVLAQARISEVARRIDRGIEVKFAKKQVSQFTASMASDLIDLAVKQKTLTPNIKLLDKAKYKIYDDESKQLANDIASSILKSTRLETELIIAKQTSDRPTFKRLLEYDNENIDNAIYSPNKDAYLSIRYSKKNRDQYIARLKKRRLDIQDRAEEQVDAIFDFLDMGVETGQIPEKKKSRFKRYTFHWLINSNIILPEDGYKIIRAVQIADAKKEDPGSYRNPNILIERYAEEVKEKVQRTNPDKVPELSNKQFVKGKVKGVTVYDIESSKAGQLALRKIVDTHWGKESDPWCLVARNMPSVVAQEMAEEFGDIVEQQGQQFDDLASSFDHWKSYNHDGNGFKVSFVDGKLNSFRDGNKKEWWNRMDMASNDLVATTMKRVGKSLHVYDTNVKTGGKLLIQEQLGVSGKNGPVINYTYFGNSVIKDYMTMKKGEIDSKVTTEIINQDPSTESSIQVDTYISNNVTFRGGIVFNNIKLEKISSMEGTQGRHMEILTEDQSRRLNEKDGGIFSEHEVTGTVVSTNNVPRLESYIGKEVSLKKTVFRDIMFSEKITVDGVEVKFAKSMNESINDMIERSSGIKSDETFSKTRGSIVGRDKSKLFGIFKRIYLPPSAEDFLGLTYQIIGKGKQGEADLKFFKEKLIDPFSDAYTKLDAIRQVVLKDVNDLNESYPEVKSKLKQKMPNIDYTYEDAIRVYLYDKHGYTVPGITTKEQANLVGRIMTDIELAVYADGLDRLSRSDKWLKPNKYWAVSNIASDLNRIVEGIHRKDLLETWIQNKNEIFSEENLNKLEAAYGEDYRNALEDMLYRMETGISRKKDGNKINNEFTNWLNNSVGAVMFLNVKSAILQTLSTVNYLNFEDNNIFAAGKAFANQKQYWSDWSMIYNSDFLKNRRAGIKTDVSLAEISENVANVSDKSKAILAYLLKKGFTPTQAADSFAIASGGAAFYRNRVNKYIKEGKTEKEAESQAFIDFREVTEETQQSARPDRVSQQQTSNAGRLILAFQNAPMQFNRIIKKSALDLINGRGDYRANISRIIYYGGIQSFIFTAMQNALFALAFDEDDEDVRGVTVFNMDNKLTAKELEKRKKFELNKIERIVNGMTDTILRGSGITGAVLATLKNTIIKYNVESKKGKRMNEGSILVEALQISPQVGSKARKLVKGLRAKKWDGEAIPFMSKFDPQNPMYAFAANITESATNIPIARILNKINNLRVTTESQHATWQRVGVALGWSAWDLGVDPSARIKEVIKKGKEQGLIKGGGTAKPCLAVKSDGMPCQNTTKNKNRLCYLHD